MEHSGLDSQLYIHCVSFHVSISILLISIQPFYSVLISCFERLKSSQLMTTLVPRSKGEACDWIGGGPGVPTTTVTTNGSGGRGFAAAACGGWFLGWRTGMGGSGHHFLI